jgi:hypothetical protein
VLPFGSPLYNIYVYKSSTLAKTNEIKKNTMLLGTFWGTHWEQKKPKKNPPHPHPCPKKLTRVCHMVT